MSCIVDASTAAEEANTERVRAFYETVVNRRDAAAVPDFLDAGFRQHSPFYGSGRDGLAVFLSGPFLAAFPDLSTSLELMIAQNDRVLAYVWWRGHHGPSGKPVELATADLFRLRDGRLVEHWDVIEYQEIEPFGFGRPEQDQPRSAPDWTGTGTQLHNLSLMHRFVEDVTVQDYSRAHLYIRPDFLQNDPMIPPGLDGFKACCEIFGALASDMQVVTRHLIVGTDYLGAIWDWAGTQDTTGVPVVVPTSDIYRLQDGMLAEHWDRVDYTFVKKIFGYHPKQLVTGGR